MYIKYMKHYINRIHDQAIADFIKSPAEHKNVLLVEGARQTGKTASVLKALEKYKSDSIILNLEKDHLLKYRLDECASFSEYQELLEDELGFKNNSGQIVFVDEAQESIKLGGFIRFMKEEWSNTTVILSGSTLRRIFRKNIRYPVGRVERILVSPFSFTEFLRATGKGNLIPVIMNEYKNISEKRHTRFLDIYNEYLLTGGMPEAVSHYTEKKDYSKIQNELLAGYKQDFMRIFGEDDISIVNSILKSTAALAGFPSKNTSVVKSPSGSMNSKINMIFSRLENWHLILKSGQEGPSPAASHKYRPKRYFFDTGLMRILREASLLSINVLDRINPGTRIAFGSVLENQLAVEINRYGLPLSGWKKSSSGMEVDFILKSRNSIHPLECKAALSVNNRHLKGLVTYMNDYDIQVGYVFSLDSYKEFDFGKKKIINIPAYSIDGLFYHGL
ncbi:MAG: ATP-binding protein [Fibrobacterota bacterium]